MLPRSGKVFVKDLYELAMPFGRSRLIYLPMDPPFIHFKAAVRFGQPGAFAVAERGCVEDQPQRLSLARREGMVSVAPNPHALRLVLRTQPRSENRRVPRRFRQILIEYNSALLPCG